MESQKPNRLMRRLAARDQRRGKSSITIEPASQLRTYAFRSGAQRGIYDSELDQDVALTLLKKGGGVK